MGGNALNEESLMASLAAGDMEALGELVRRHQEKAFALAYRMLERRDLAEDVAQEAFLQVHGAAKRYRPDAKFTTWLYRIVVNLCLDAKRRGRRAPAHLENGADRHAQAPSDPIEASERVKLVRRAVDALPERQRTAVILHRYQDLSHQEIAQATGWSESAVESLLVRAYASLRQALAKFKE